jgi:mRNA interferase HigB
MLLWMRVISRRTLRAFWEYGNAAAEAPLTSWFKEAEAADWCGPQDIKAAYASASILANDRVVFNIKGNTIRLVVAIKYKTKIVYVRFVGTHAEYDKIDAEEI